MFTPDAWADASTYTEQQYWRDSIAQSLAWFADERANQMTPAMQTAGTYVWPRNSSPGHSFTGPWNITDGSVPCFDMEPWMRGYLSVAVGIGFRQFGDDTSNSLGTNFGILAQHLGNFYSQWHATGQSTWVLGNSQGSYGPGDDTGHCYGVAALSVPPNMGLAVSVWGDGANDQGLNFDFSDTTNGWVTLSNTKNGSASTTTAPTTLTANQLISDTQVHVASSTFISTGYVLAVGSEFELVGSTCGTNCWNVTRGVETPIGGAGSAAAHTSGDFVLARGLPFLSIGDVLLAPGQDTANAINPSKSGGIMPSGFTRRTPYYVVALDATRPGGYAFKLSATPGGSPIIPSTTAIAVTMEMTVLVNEPQARSGIVTADPGGDFVKTFGGLDMLILAGITDTDMLALQTDAVSRYAAFPQWNYPAVDPTIRPQYWFVDK
jgi:hypothetical protein